MDSLFVFILHAMYKTPNCTPSSFAKQHFLPEETVQEGVQFLCEKGFLAFVNGNCTITEKGLAFLSMQGTTGTFATADERQTVLSLLCEALQITADTVQHFVPMSVGMTNLSYIVQTANGSYIFRMPGVGTDKLIDRYREYSNYLAVEGAGIADVVVYHNPLTGVKITQYIPNCRTANPKSSKDISVCMSVLRQFHKSGLTVSHTFDFAQYIYYYEILCSQQQVSFSPSHLQEKQAVQWLLSSLNKTEKEFCFCHIDSVPNNFLISSSGSVTLIDWEYAGMCDPLADVAMWCISAAYEKTECDSILPAYLEREPTQNEWSRFYSYLSLGGFLWGLWAYYKASFGATYGNYINRMSAFCLQYYAYAQAAFTKNLS